MIYKQLELPFGGHLYIAQCASDITPIPLTYYRWVTQALLNEIAPSGTRWQIAHHTTGAPYLVPIDESARPQYHISISHSGYYVALAIRPARYEQGVRSGIGIDLQVASDKLSQVVSRFMAPSELAYYEQLTASEATLQDSLGWLYTVWGFKEAAYKAYPLSVRRSLVNNYIVDPPDDTCQPMDHYTIRADEGRDGRTLLKGYQLSSIVDSPYHLTYVTTDIVETYL